MWHRHSCLCSLSDLEAAQTGVSVADGDLALSSGPLSSGPDAKGVTDEDVERAFTSIKKRRRR